QTVLITGIASAPVTLDGKSVEATDAAGQFFTRVTILPGQNEFEIKAVDAKGQSASATLTLTGVAPSAGPIGFSRFSDVSVSFNAGYGRTSFNQDTGVLYGDALVRNTGKYPADAPLIVGVKNISDPTVRAVEFDGVLPDGTPYYDYTKRMT